METSNTQALFASVLKVLLIIQNFSSIHFFWMLNKAIKGCSLDAQRVFIHNLQFHRDYVSCMRSEAWWW